MSHASSIRRQFQKIQHQQLLPKRPCGAALRKILSVEPREDSSDDIDEEIVNLIKFENECTKGRFLFLADVGRSPGLIIFIGYIADRHTISSLSPNVQYSPWLMFRMIIDARDPFQS